MQKWHPGAPTCRGRSNRDTQDAGATPGGTRASTTDKEEGRSKAGEATRIGGDGRACTWEAATTRGMADGLAIQPRCYQKRGQPMLNRHQVGAVSRSPAGLFAQREREPTRGRLAVRGKGTYDGRSGQHVEEQGTYASRTRKHSEVGYGRPMDKGAWTPKTVKRPRRQPTQPHTPTTGLCERGNDTSKTTGRNGRQNAATRHNMRREDG